MISRKLSTRLRPVAFAVVAALIGAGAATIGLSPDENASASAPSEQSSTTGTQEVAEVAEVAASAPFTALVNLFHGC